jgi:hypothetical protein
LSTATSPLTVGQPFTATGSGYRGFGLAEASGGGFNNSASNYPLVRLQRQDNGQTVWLPLRAFSDTALTTRAAGGIAPGYAQATVFVNGIPSVARVVLVKPQLTYLPLTIRG